jgi:hypothetical protein
MLISLFLFSEFSMFPSLEHLWRCTSIILATRSTFLPFAGTPEETESLLSALIGISVSSFSLMSGIVTRLSSALTIFLQALIILM